MPAAQSAPTERLARITAAAEHVWGNHADAQTWLAKPHPELENRAPLEAALSELGARRAEDLLNRLLDGLPT